jgi:hypothetical protein
MKKYKIFLRLYYDLKIIIYLIIYLIPILLIRFFTNFFKTEYIGLIFLLHKYDDYKKKNLSGENEYLSNSCYDFNIKSRNFSIDSKYSFITNLKFIYYSFLYSKSVIVFRSDSAFVRTFIDLSVVLFLNKVFKVIFVAISNDSNWFINIYRSYLLYNNNIILCIDDRNLLLTKKIKKRICSLCISRKIFYVNDFFKKKIIIAFIGRINNMPDRIEKLNFLKKNNVNIKVFNKDIKYLDYSEYLHVLSDTKILLNFNEGPIGSNKNHSVGRAFQGIASGCMILEPEKSYLPRIYFKKNRDYISYDNNLDLLNKILYYTNNLKAVHNISKNGQKRLSQLYQSENLFNFLLEKKILSL